MQHWSKLDGDTGEPWPVGRRSHAAVCLGLGGDHPHLLVTGGWVAGLKTLDDAWALDVRSWRWREVSADWLWDDDGIVSSQLKDYICTCQL